MKTFFIKFIFFFYMVGALFKTIKLKFLDKHSCRKKYEAYLNKSVYNWAKFVVNLAGIRLEVKGEEYIPKESCLFVSNHQSNFDIPCLIAALNMQVGFIAKKELGKVPVISTWMKAIHCVFMDRENVRESLKAILEGAQILKDGHSMIIFPEGTRSKGNDMGEFKKGSMKLATKAEVLVVPVTINGTYKALEGNEGNKIKSADVKIIIHKPINVKDLDKEGKNALMENVKGVVEKGLEV